MAKKKQNQPVNPMKDGPEEESVNEVPEGTPVFESEDVAAYAAEAAEEYGLELDGIKGTGENGVITAEDVDKAVEIADQVDEDNNPPADTEKNDEDQDADNTAADTSDDKEEAVNFASDEAGEFYVENKDTINLDDVKGTGKDGAITKGDLKKALPKEDPKPAEEPKTDDKPAEDSDEGQTDNSFKGFLEEFIQFGLPVKGALRHKPLVQERWNDLYQRALKIKETL